jgi:small-conductance mechanosensitive channel
VLEVEILPRLTSKHGLPFAVAAVTRYLLVTAGVLLAMAAMGVDFTRVTLLAGALGVGIGFGLQGVVNNFVSGLILLTERPVNVGDIVQLGPLRGTIRRIGVRSTTVQTPQGAEVIVPNADLISKEVTNWTLSDRRRRLEIDVGVAYGTEPEQAVKLLEAAAKEVAEVLRNPPPLALCTGFGDSAINFRLEAWIDDYARGMANDSALRMAIVKKFREANIEIPFPQRDVHIRTAPAARVTPSTGRS